MSRLPFTVNVNEFVCTELDRMRKMIETHDFSGLAASIERVQLHVSGMEEALYTYNEALRYGIKEKMNDDKLDDSQFRDYVRTKIKNVFPEEK